MSRTYTNIIAELYDYCPFFSKLRVESGYALEFYMPVLEREYVGKVLELGSATGNMTIPIAKKGIKIDSVDISEDMHRIIREKMRKEPENITKKVNLITEDVFLLDIKDKYDMVIMPDNFLSAMSSYEEQERLFKLAAEALEPGGLLVFDVSPPNQFLIEGKYHSYICRTNTPSKKGYVVRCEITIDKEKHLNCQHYTISRYCWEQNRKEQYSAQINYRYLYRNEIEDMLRINGFELVEVRDEISSGVRECAYIAKRNE